MLYQTLITYGKLFLRNIDKNDIRIFLESSPQYPNLLSVIQTLQYAGLDAQAGQCDWEYLKNLDTPFLLHLKSGSHENVVIAKWDKELNRLKSYKLKERKWIVNDKKDIKDYWNGIVIYTNNPPISKRVIDPKSIVLSVIIGIILLSAVCFFALKINTIYYTPIFLGCVISGCLYFKTEMPSSLIDRLCHISKVTDCERVENSSYSSLFGFNMSCLAFSFFASQLICMGIGYILGATNILDSLYFISTIILLPILAYSVYGQVKIRSICPLCMLVLLCIAAEIAISLYWSYSTIRLNIIAVYSGVFTVSTITLQYIHNIKQKESAYQTERLDLLKLKRKKAILHSESIPANPTKTPIGFGEKDSSTVVTTLISPNCSHCRKMVSEFLKLQNKGVRFRWNIILGQTTPMDSDIIDIWIQQYYADKDKFFEYLHFWSNDSAGRISQPRVKKTTDTISFSDIKQSFEKEIMDMNISGFPRIILNDRLLSQIYTPKDIEFIIIDENA